MIAGACLGTISLCFAAFATGWQKDSNGWWYQRQDGSYPSNCWEQLDDGMGNLYWYYFNQDGYMYSNDVTPDGYYVALDGHWVEEGSYTEEQLRNIILNNSSGTIYTSVVADFNGDGKFEMVAVLTNTEAGDGMDSRGVDTSRWYTDGVNTYCYDQSHYWWLKEDTFYLVHTNDGVHLAETVVSRTAADMCDSTITKFTNNGATKLYYGDGIYFTGVEGARLLYEKREPENPHQGIMYLVSTESGTLAYVNGSYQTNQMDKRTLKERYGENIVVYAENPIDEGDCYQYNAKIAQVDGYGVETGTCWSSTLKVKKDAVVMYYDNISYKRLSLSEYGIDHLRMFDTAQDENSYIISFTDFNVA